MNHCSKFKNFHLKCIPIAWIILIVALIITLWSWTLLTEANYQRVKTTAFDYRVTNIKNAILNRMFIYQQVLKGTAGLFAVSASIKRSEWHDYVQNLQLDKNYPDVQGLGFIKRILPDEKARHIAEIRAEGGFFQDYTLKPEGEREEYAPVIYIEPMDQRNQRVLGYDEFSEPVRRLALERARDMGEATLSGKVTLVQETNEDIQAGCILYAPIYRKDTMPNTVVERRAALIGYVYSPFHINDLMHGILGKQQAEIDFEIYDSDNIDDFNPNALMYDEVPNHEVSNYPSRFRTVEQLEIAGHIWTIRFVSLPQFDIATRTTRSSNIILWSGAIISFLLFGMIRLWSLAIRQEYRSQLQQEMAERQRIELALHHSEKKYQRIVEAAQEGIWVIDAQANTIYINAKMARMLGYSETEMIGKSLFDFMDNIAQQEAQQHFERRSRGISEIHDFRFQCKEGNDLWAIVSTVALLDNAGHFAGGLAMVTDITQRKLVEIALENQRNTLQAILDNIPVGIHVHEAIGDRKIILANRYGENILGKPTLHGIPLDQLSKTYGTFRYGTDEFYPVEQMPLTRALLGEIAMTEDLEVRRDGTRVFLEAVAAPIRDHTGKITAAIVIFSDITERKKIELALRQAKEQAEIANRAKSVFLANMSHELRTPLNGILGYAQILGLDDDTLTEDQRQGIRVIAQSGEYLLTLINDILDLAKIEAGKVELSPTIIELEELLQGITRLFTVRAEQKGLEFCCKLLTSLPFAIYADEKKLRQVIINLLGNAFKFTQRGHITLKVAYADEMLHFQVEDSGCGIASDNLDKIFDPFQQVGHEKYKAQGTGLGLSITKNLVEMMGGTLRVTSVLGQGSTFAVALKLPEAPAVLQSAHLSPLSKIIGYQGEQRTVLIIDDNWTNRAILVRMLTHLGFKTLEAESGHAGLNKVCESPPFDVILVDLVMPELNGFDVIAQLKMLPQSQKTVLIAISASAFEEDRQHSLELGCHAFIAKPIKFDLLLECLRVHLNLTWLYEQEVITSIPSSSTSEPATVALTPSQIEELLELAKQGDIMEIGNFAERLPQSDENLAAFARYLRQLVAQFKVGEILKVVRKLSDSKVV